MLSAQVSQRLCQTCIALNVLDEEVGKSQKLQDLTQASGLWPINNRLHLLGIRLKTILAEDVTQVRQFGLAPNTLGCLDQHFVLMQLRQNCLQMQLVLSSSVVENQYVINEDNCKF